ncbi:MAG: hypothetical protein GY792_17825 [Gammaproteobacteria bacterium]|nr:hypothetical protein [Gammaproteobacteria bacterium]
MAQFLNVNPADLTVLKKNSGGEYPFMRIFQTIDGRAVIAGHGERAMPVWGGVIKWRALNLKTAVGSRQSRQALGVPSKTEKLLITNKVITSFSISLCTPISYLSFSRSTAVSRLKDMVHLAMKQRFGHGFWNSSTTFS